MNGKADKAKWEEFSTHIFYQAADLNNAETYRTFGDRIQHYKEQWKQEPHIIYYLAVAPKFFPIIAENISKNNLADNPDTTRIVIEKPFGHDLESARSLNRLICIDATDRGNVRNSKERPSPG